MDWIKSGRLVLGMACAALFLVGYDGGSCDGAGDGPETTEAANEARPPPSGCGTVCDIWCEHGNVLDANGCATCACNPAPETGAGGSAGGCSGVICQLWCEYGNVLDADGCPTCACNPAPNEPANHCQGLGERACNATSGCLGIYDDSCACSPCPDGVDCFCDCPEPTEPAGAFLRCVLDRPAPPQRPARPCNVITDCGDEESCIDGVCVGGQMCRTDGDCPAGLLCAANWCVPDAAVYQCSSDADCREGGICEPYVTCMAIGCPPPGTHCVYPDCGGAVLNNDNECVRPDGTVVDLACCRAN
jgi:hypothetical protein